MRRLVPAALVAGLLVGGCGTPLGAEASDPAAAALPSVRPSLPAGWRWESYADLEVAVPASWQPTQRRPTTQPCHPEPDGRWVMRAPLPLMENANFNGCPEDLAAAALVRNTGRFVAFGLPVPDGMTTLGRTSLGDRTTVVTERATVAVQAPAVERDRVLATLHTITTAAVGCAADDPFGEDRARRPSPAAAVSGLTGVQYVTACLYGLSPEAPWYTGCEGNGIDDGVTVRRLTRAAVRPLLGGPTAYTAYLNSPGKREVLLPVAR